MMGDVRKQLLRYMDARLTWAAGCSAPSTFAAVRWNEMTAALDDLLAAARAEPGGPGEKARGTGPDATCSEEVKRLLAENAALIAAGKQLHETWAKADDEAKRLRRYETVHGVLTMERDGLRADLAAVRAEAERLNNELRLAWTAHARECAMMQEAGTPCDCGAPRLRAVADAARALHLRHHMESCRLRTAAIGDDMICDCGVPELRAALGDAP